MDKSYNYLKDPRVLDEIRRHKWLESEKAKKEIGFASAAVEWIVKHGPQWRKYHGSHQFDA